MADFPWITLILTTSGKGLICWTAQLRPKAKQQIKNKNHHTLLKKNTTSNNKKTKSVQNSPAVQNSPGLRYLSYNSVVNIHEKTIEPTFPDVSVCKVGAFCIIISRVNCRDNRIGPMCSSVHLSVCLLISALTTELFDVLMVFVCRSIMAKGLWGERTLQHRSREVRQHSGVFIHIFRDLSEFMTSIANFNTPPPL